MHGFCTARAVSSASGVKAVIGVYSAGSALRSSFKCSDSVAGRDPGGRVFGRSVGCDVGFGQWATAGHGVSLSAALGALRDELMHAVWAGQLPYQLNGEARTLRFKPTPIDVTLH